MRIINRLALPGKIRSVGLSLEEVIVRLVNDEVIVYRRIENEDIPTEGQESYRRSTLH